MEYLYIILKVILFYIILKELFKVTNKKQVNKLDTTDLVYLIVISLFLFNILNGKITIFTGIFIIIVFGICILTNNKLESRYKNIFSKFINNIKSKYNYIKKETNNEKFIKQDIPLVLILDGDIDYDTLDILNKDKIWLENNIDCDIEEIFYAFYNNNKIYIIKKRDFRKLN